MLSKFLLNWISWTHTIYLEHSLITGVGLPLWVLLLPRLSELPFFFTLHPASMSLAMTVLPLESHVRLLNVSEWWEICDVTTRAWAGRGAFFSMWNDQIKRTPKAYQNACLESEASRGRDKLLTDNKAISFSFPYWFQLFHKEESRGCKDPCLSYTGGFFGAAEDTFCFVFQFIAQFVPYAIIGVGFLFSQHGLPTKFCCRGLLF